MTRRWNGFENFAPRNNTVCELCMSQNCLRSSVQPQSHTRLLFCRGLYIFDVYSCINSLSYFDVRIVIIVNHNHIHRSKKFDSLRNDPNYSSVCSNLSPWINAGQISFQRLALEIRALKKHPNGTAAYIEEGVVRRELSDNFVYYTPDGYDSLDGAAAWARDSLELHREDDRERSYDWKELERGESHDDLWNAAQLQLVREGGMHGFVS
mmetsp:Transcript_23111/g.41276  ORF Transcript_23111/g.41276 Transcript_23111/m.41276 type:complete len:209 (-) Transcript_23111:509-1135(-)